MLSDRNVRLPIAREPQAPPVYRKEFSSDAAGPAANQSDAGGPGVASIGLSEEGELCFAFKHTWSSNMISFEKDSKGKRFGDKSTTLELVGILLPLVLIPNQLRRQHVVMKVDNMACIFGWENTQTYCRGQDSFNSHPMHPPDFRLSGDRSSHGSLAQSKILGKCDGRRHVTRKNDN